MKDRSAPLKAAAVLLMLILQACVDDRVSFERGPLGPASYEVTVTASNDASEDVQEHVASLRVEQRAEDARLTLRSDGGLVTVDLDVEPDGSANLARLRGAPSDTSSSTELASLAGQLNPPLPSGPVRIGDSWSSTQKISTKVLAASLQTELRLRRFTRVASTDAASFIGEVSGSLKVTEGATALQGQLEGTTRILWAVEAGRVVEADTDLLWTLSDGSEVELSTRVRPV